MTVAFIGHRNVVQTETLENQLKEVITTLIEDENADTFLFGSKSNFDSICYKVVSALKETYSHIKRVYVRAVYEYIDRDYTDYLLSFYEETFFPDKVNGAGTNSYVVRNRVMVDMCDVLVTYCDENYTPAKKINGSATFNVVKQHNKRSGTVISNVYAHKKKKRIINLFAH